MKLYDKLHFAFHNLKQNIFKSFLTILVISILSIVFMGAVIIGITFTSSFDKTLCEEVKKNNFEIVYETDKKIDKDIFNIFTSNIENKNFESLLKLSFENVSIIDLNCYKLHIVQSIKNETLNKSIFVNISENAKYYLGDDYEFHNTTYLVAGYFDNIQDKAIIDLNDFWNNYSLNTFERSNLSLSYVYNKGDNVLNVIDTYTKIFNKLSKITPKNYYNGYEDFLYFSSPFANIVNNAKTIKIVITSLMIFIALIGLISTIGIITNNIFILLDENKRFFAIEKLLGISKKDLFEIMIFQIAITLLIGVIISEILIIISTKLLGQISFELLQLTVDMVMDSGTFENIFVKYTYPIYVPIAYFFVITSFVILYSKTSIFKILKKSPVELTKDGIKNDK